MDGCRKVEWYYLRQNVTLIHMKIIEELYIVASLKTLIFMIVFADTPGFQVPAPSTEMQLFLLTYYLLEQASMVSYNLEV